MVALPLALAFGVASGLGAAAGLWGAILTGLFAALFGGTRAQITGPTGPMTVLMAAEVTRHATHPELALTVVMMAGALQILFGRLGLGRYVTYLPYKVISGFMSGIGVLIILLQLAPLLGAGNVPNAVTALTLLPRQLVALNPHALWVGLATLAVVLAWPKPARRWLPAPLAALLAGAVLATLWLPGAPTIGAVSAGLPQPVVPQVDPSLLPAMLRSAFTLALLGSIDSLLTSLVADNLTRDRHDSNRELLGQGLGNVVAGLFGGIPGAGATVRTVVNVRAGGRTRLSGAFHALVLAAVALGLGTYAAYVPLAALAGILLKVGWDIIDWDYLRRMRSAPRQAMFVMSTVLLLTVFVDLITAVAVGLIMTSLISAQMTSAEQLSKLHLVTSDDPEARLSETERSLMREAGGRVLLLHLSGPFSFGSATELVRRMAAAGTSQRAVVLDLGDVTLMDASIAMAIDQIIRRSQDAGQSVWICGYDAQRHAVLKRMDVLRHLPAAAICPDRETALRQALSTTPLPSARH